MRYLTERLRHYKNVATWMEITFCPLQISACQRDTDGTYWGDKWDILERKWRRMRWGLAEPAFFKRGIQKATPQNAL